MRIFDEHIKNTLLVYAEKLEDFFNSDVMFFYGPMYPLIEKQFRDFIEKLACENPDCKKLTIFLNTPGGVTETVEKLVIITRKHYPTEVNFVIPDEAMSAGTIFCMSGDNIYMDYSSSLGPIDPQIWDGKHYVPALGYLDQFNRMIEKSRTDDLTDAELILMQRQDLALLNKIEQARELTTTLLQTWLAKYKFKNWDKHQTNPNKKGKPVTEKEKAQRAALIAKKLSDNTLWHSHGRMIGIDTLKNLLKLKIEDYSEEDDLREMIRCYSDILVDYITRSDISFFLHSKNYF